MSASPRRMAGRVLADLGSRQRLRLALAGAAMLLSAGLKAVIPVLIGMLVSSSLAAGGTVRLGGALPAILGLALAVLVQQAFEVCRRQLVEAVATRFERDNRVRICHRMVHRDLDELAHEQVGALTGRANRSIEGTTRLLKLFALDLLPSLVSALVAVSVVLAKDWRVALAMFGVIPTGFVITRRQVRSQAGIRIAVRDHKERVDAEVAELLPMLASVRTVGAEPQILARIGAHCDRLRATEVRHHQAMSLYDAGKFVNEAGWQIVVLCIAVLLLGRAGPVAAGDITTYALLFAAVLAPLRELHRIIDEAAESAQQAGDFYALLDAPVDRGFAAGRPAPLDPAAPAVRVRDVRFRHAGSAIPVLAGVDLEVAVGERIGLVGPTGCGKSTLLRLLRRLHHGYEGVIELGGQDLRTLDHAALSTRVGYVAQEPHIVRGTIADNIRLGSPDATDAEVHEAARRAHVIGDILAMPDAFETRVEERGSTLSGGQRQRLCIARALLRRPELLLMDEPTSALDPASERAVQRTIDALTDVTVIVVAHRLDTLRNTDRVVVLEDGRVAQEGPFEVLEELDGPFRRLRVGSDAPVPVR